RMYVNHCCVQNTNQCLSRDLQNVNFVPFLSTQPKYLFLTVDHVNNPFLNLDNEKYFLTKNPNKITIITAMYARIKTNKWTGDKNEEVKIFINTKNRILKDLTRKNEKIRFEKLMFLEDTKAAVQFKALEVLMELVEISEWKKDAKENINKLQTVL
ncbi:7107_t:CDS:2, partial [Gigaspora margarita]